MYAQYTWLPAATAAQIVEDICKLVCGETVIANLSAGCDAANTSIVANTITSNWVLHDAAAGTDARVISSLNADGSTTKYVNVNWTANTIKADLWETWNAGTHAGTNLAVSARSVPGATGSAGRVMLIVSPRYFILHQNPSVGVVVVGNLEFSRDSPLLDSTYPCVVASQMEPVAGGIFGSSGVLTKLSRHKNPIGPGDLVGAATWNTAAERICASDGVGSDILPTSIQGVGGAAWYPVRGNVLMLLGHASFGKVPLGILQGGILQMETSGLAYNPLDEIVVAGTTYIMLKLAAVSPGAAALLLPKG